MAGLFQGLEIGKRALMTHQLSMQIVGHNIANVDTPGYSRQRVRTGTAPPTLQGLHSIGTGVNAMRIEQARDLFLNEQFRSDNRRLGEWTYKEKTMSQIELLLGEPNDDALAGMMDNFWGAWQALARGDAGSRDAIVQNANLVTNSLHDLSSQLIRLQDAADVEMVELTSKVNQLTSEIARLNHNIKRQELGAGPANDLRDSRDYLVDQLSNIIDVRTRVTDQGDFLVYMGSLAVVDQDTSFEIGANIVNADGRVSHELVWKGASFTVINLSGSLKGVMDARDEIIPRYLEKLDEIAAALVTQVNSVHRGGFGADGSTGLNFFDPSGVTAQSIRVASDIVLQPSRIASSLSGEPGDTLIAKAIADIQGAKLLIGNTQSLSDYYVSMIGSLGIESQEASIRTQNYEALLNQIENKRMSVQGVSLDEEMANLVKYQHAYNAAARVITTMDSALDTVITRMGLVGR
jgi:flagellar hook-associated protein 1 FlgK